MVHTSRHHPLVRVFWVCMAVSCCRSAALGRDRVSALAGVRTCFGYLHRTCCSFMDGCCPPLQHPSSYKLYVAYNATSTIKHSCNEREQGLIHLIASLIWELMAEDRKEIVMYVVRKGFSCPHFDSDVWWLGECIWVGQVGKYTNDFLTFHPETW